ncbi:MAG: Hsp20/alpha crystallin family protein [Gammaproteobacteria bacterium]|nr:Hsp20/alpha crystallin family protein [Gammaproteobacteria bacterium]
MSTFEDLHGGINRFWDSVAEGWRHLVSRASGALTRFRPSKSKEGALLPDEVRGSGWGLLAADLRDDGETVVVRLEAPGMELDDFDLCITDDVLIVRGEKQYQSERDEGGYRIAECAYGAFERAIPLPDSVDGSRAKAKYRRGVLRIEMPKIGAKRHTIKIAAE